MRNDLHTASRVSELLAQRVRDVAKMLVPSGRIDGNEFVFGNATGTAGNSAKLHLSGEHAGKWRDWANESDHGDLLDLWSSARGVSLQQAIKDAKEWLGLRDLAPYKAKSYAMPGPRPLKNLSPQGRALEWFRTQRLLIEETVNAFRVVGDGKNIVFPHISPDGVTVNRCFRNLASKAFEYDKGCAPGLFGWHALRNPKARKVVLCEGQIDCMTWWQWGFDALSVYGGVSNMNWIEYDWDNLAVFDTIYVSMDMDEAGRKASRLICDRLGIARCLEVTLPNKDANDCLLAGVTATDATEWLEKAKAIQMDGLITATECRKDIHDLFFRRDDLAQKFFRPPLLRGSGGAVEFRNGEVTAWTGHASHGKSTLLGFLACGDVGCRGSSYFFASMEMLPAKVLYKMATATVGLAPEPATLDAFVDEVGSRLFFANVLGYIDEERLFQMMEYCCLRYGINAAVIDSFMAITELEEDYPRQGAFMSNLAQFSKRHDIHIHLIVHPAKGDESIAPSMTSLKGSSLIYNRADVVLAVQRNMEKARMVEDGQPVEELLEVPDAFVYCRKDRETGWKGKLELWFDRRTNHFKRFPDKPATPREASKPYAD